MAKKRPATADTSKAAVTNQPEEHGASGTENYGGTITGVEYNPQLAPPDGFRIYDEMRMSDPNVQASLEIVKTPLMSGNWSVQPPKDPQPQEQEVADFCHSALFERGAMADTWKYFLEHALLQLDFGVMPFEKVWTLGADQRIRLNRLAPRLPRTIQKWNVDQEKGTGQLLSMEQLAMKGKSFQTLTIPAADMAVFVRRREGDNWWGRSILRTAYKPWYYLTLAERIEAVRLHRFGVGVPIVTRDKDHTPQAGELEKVEKIAKGMASHENAYIITNTAYTWDILMPKGSSAGDGGTREAIAARGKDIMRNVLAEFMSGGPDGLNSSRARTQSEVFTSMLYSTAEDLIGVLDLHVLRPLCNYNFPMEAQKLRYPSIVANDVTEVDIKQMADILGRLVGMKVLTADDDLEGFIRELMGLPAMAENAKGKSRERVVIQPGQPTPPKTKGKPGEKPIDEAALARALNDARPAIAATKSARVFTLDGRDYCRQPTNFELRVFSLDAVPDRLEAQTAELMIELRDIRRDQLNTLAGEIAARTDAKELRPTQFSVTRKSDVKKAILSRMRDVATFGAEQVRLELSKQVESGDDALALALVARRQPQAVLSELVLTTDGASDDAQLARELLATSAKVTAEAETDYWFNRILETALRLRRTGIEGEALRAAIIEALTPELETGLKALAKGEMNEAFGIGRATEATALQEQISTVEYSCLLDANSCDKCVNEDGKTFEFQSKDYFRTLPPFKDCDGNKGRPDACRCVHLYHLQQGASAS